MERKDKLPEHLDELLYELNKECWRVGTSKLNEYIVEIYRQKVKELSEHYDVGAHEEISGYYIDRLEKLKIQEEARRKYGG